MLFIDEIHTVIGAGATSGDAMDASEPQARTLRGLDPLHRLDHLQNSRNHFEKDRALLRRFQKIDVNEPTVEDATIESSPGCAPRSKSITTSSTPPTRSSRQWS